jgi:hypothetical protein
MGEVVEQADGADKARGASVEARQLIPVFDRRAGEV